MAFLDELQKGLSNAAAFTVQKTGELTDFAKLKYNLHVSEGKLQTCYAEIGRLFHDTQKTGTEHTSEIATLIMQADKLIDDIAAMKAESAKNKKTTVCANCAAEVSKECTFCPVCGTKIESECTCCDESCDCDEACDCGEAENDCGCGCDEE